MDCCALIKSSLTAGWVIPIVILFVISFPPLFGHEVRAISISGSALMSQIVTILVGVVWGLWKGFGIVAAGQLQWACPVLSLHR